MAQLYLLDTNTASYVMNDRSPATRKEFDRALGADLLSISAISEAELKFGLRKRPEATRLREAFDLFRKAVDVLPWDSETSTAYSELRFQLRARVATLDVMDLLIAAHAMSVGAVLVSRDRAFEQVKDLVKVVNWTTDLK